MNIALIFAGGTGQRMNTRSKPKQFLDLHGKPIIIYTLEHFQTHPMIDTIVIVCLKGWIEILKRLLDEYGISKAKLVVSGGSTGHDSIYLGLKKMENFSQADDIVLIHDGVRPFITKDLITKNIRATQKKGNAITVESVRESVVRSADGSTIDDVPPRNNMYVAKAPQTFFFQDIFSVYQKAQNDGFKSIDSAHLCYEYNIPLHMIKSTRNNMKITEPADYYILRALYDAMENEQIWGL